jgi:hypothetical protein
MKQIRAPIWEQRWIIAKLVMTCESLRSVTKGGGAVFWVSKVSQTCNQYSAYTACLGYFSSLKIQLVIFFWNVCKFLSGCTVSHIRNIHSYIIFVDSSTKQARSRDIAVGIATGYGLDDRGVGVWVPVGSRILSSPRRQDRLWGSPNLLSNGYRGLFPRGVKLTTHLHLIPRSRKYVSLIHYPIRLHGVALN